MTAAEAKEKELGEKISVLRIKSRRNSAARKSREIQAALEKLEAAKSETFGHEQRIASSRAPRTNRKKSRNENR